VGDRVVNEVLEVYVAIMGTAALVLGLYAMFRTYRR
jgi:hypothetical protein